MKRKPRTGKQPRPGKKRSRPGRIWGCGSQIGLLLVLIIVCGVLLFVWWSERHRTGSAARSGSTDATEPTQPTVSTAPPRPVARKPRPASAPSSAPAAQTEPTAAPAAGTTRAKPLEAPSDAPPAPSDFEPAVTGSRGVIALVLDDLGYEDGSLARLEAFSGPLALAVIPSAPKAAQAAALAKRKGWDLLVHLPMKAEAAPGETDSFGPEDDDRTIVQRVTRGLDRLPGAVGLNNHQGSKATADSRVVRAMLRVVRDRGLFFLDSRTTPASVAESEARALGISTIRRDVFLDDAATEAHATGGSSEALAGAWSRALAIARKKGHCVVIGHPHRETLQFLAAHLSEMDGTTFERVRVSELVD